MGSDDTQGGEKGVSTQGVCHLISGGSILWGVVSSEGKGGGGRLRERERYSKYSYAERLFARKKPISGARGMEGGRSLPIQEGRTSFRGYWENDQLTESAPTRGKRNRRLLNGEDSRQEVSAVPAQSSTGVANRPLSGESRPSYRALTKRIQRVAALGERDKGAGE